MVENKRVKAKMDAISFWEEVWCLSTAQAETKFNQQPSKWQKRQVNRFLKNA